ncbi:hypothetical protein DL766_007953 [Monosporascus sp. MC13-8B]|uniref:AB hydrolase-1 domain-containing protein n=1 Tax=Monosporascus cannonballus TaxID=155416 RepID=A0ABY0H1K5_9PEZI|nr:hypothetical protein DL762_006616 [Monosporascus cannonballus]RYO93453.1 hypothetical protein DL763_004356 [Monosporascus cannonballus]RYP21415.1 hypothetical protein DL766_007953 [Monosporascus sp. MC13-8B]
MSDSERRDSPIGHDVIRLPHKPTAPLKYGFVQGRGRLAETHLVVFLNGLIGTQSIWERTIEELVQQWTESGNSNHPSLLTYDRYGQGHSAPDPYDETHGHGHDLHEVVRDLHLFVSEIWKQKRGQAASASFPKLVFVANSVGCVIGRFFAETRPGLVTALLLLDSNMANSDQVSLFPDPDAPGFDPAAAGLPDGVTVDDLRKTREMYRELFHPSVPNPESLDRRSVPELLPHADRPHLVGPDGRGPWITVVGHDWDKFAADCAHGVLNSPKALTNAYVNPAWARYNQGLTRLTDDERADGPMIADGCGHFIQSQDPFLVARLLQSLLEKVDSDL